MITFLLRKSGPRRRSIENPNTPLSDPDPWLIDAWGGGASTSGVHVNSDSALTYSPVWRAVNLIGRDVAKLPLFLYTRQGMGKERDTSHPAYFLLRYKPNEEQTAFQFRLLLTSHACLRGNGYAWIRQLGPGKPKELIPLHPAKTKPYRIDGRIHYETEIDGKKTVLDRGDVFHLRGLGDDLEGKSVVAKARESFGIGMAAQTYGGAFFANSLRPSAVLEHPGRMHPDAEQNLRESWEKMHGALGDKHRVAILEEGMKLHPWSISNEDAQFLETRQFELREVANWFGIPPHKLGDTTRTAFASLEQENQAYLDDALDPWLVAWEAEAWDKLLSKEEKLADTKVIEFLRQALLRANMSDRGAFYNLAIQGGWMNRDEVRARENLNPIPEGEGQKFFIPKNMGLTGEEEGEQPPAAAPPPAEEDQEEDDDRGRELQAAHRALLADVILRMVRRVTLTARRRAKAPGTFMAWLEDELETEHRGVALEAALPVVEVLRHAAGCREASALVDLLFGEARAALLGATDCQPALLERMVKKVCERMEATLPGVLTEIFLGGGEEKLPRPPGESSAPCGREEAQAGKPTDGVPRATV